MRLLFFVWLILALTSCARPDDATLISSTDDQQPHAALPCFFHCLSLGDIIIIVEMEGARQPEVTVYAKRVDDGPDTGNSAKTRGSGEARLTLPTGDYEFYVLGHEKDEEKQRITVRAGLNHPVIITLK